MHGLAALMEHCRMARLTRNQHILLRLGELIAWTETAASLCRRATSAIENRLDEKSDQQLKPETLAAMARVLARQAAAKIAGDGMALIVGAEAAEPAGLSETVNVNAIHRAFFSITDRR